MAKRIIGRVDGAHPGPLGIVIGALHGNEPAGPDAIRAALAALMAERAHLHGSVIGVIGNVRAAGLGIRYGCSDLNRGWFHDPSGECAPVAADEGFEAGERRDLLALLEACERERPVSGLWVIDLHSTSGSGPPFACGPDALGTRALGAALAAPFVLGIEESIPGSFVGFCAERGHPAIAFEGGQNHDPKTARRMVDAIRAALYAQGQLRSAARGWPKSAVGGARSPAGGVAHRRIGLHGRDRATLAPPETCDLRYRHAIVPGGGFVMDPGFRGFQTVAKGRRLAEEAGEVIYAPEAGYLLLPLYQSCGTDGFFIVTAIGRGWRSTSRLLRRGRSARRLLGRLPGVTRSPERRGRYRLGSRWTGRWPRGLFRLLGLRAGPAGEWVLRE